VVGLAGAVEEVKASALLFLLHTVDRLLRKLTLHWNAVGKNAPAYFGLEQLFSL
jgi:hypothetical protein